TAEWISRIEHQCCLGRYVTGPADLGRDRSQRAVDPGEAAREVAADNAFLNPIDAFLQFSISRQTRELCARACPARRSIVCSTRAQDEVSRLGFAVMRRAKEFNMVHLDKPSVTNGVSGGQRIGKQLAGAIQR